MSFDKTKRDRRCWECKGFRSDPFDVVGWCKEHNCPAYQNSVACIDFYDYDIF